MVPRGFRFPGRAMSTTIERPLAPRSWIPAIQYPYEGRHIEVDGGSMHYVDEGAGQPIVFVHGLPAWSFVFRHLIRGLSGSYRCVAPDLIGFGLSDKPPHWGYSPLDQCHNLGRLIDRLGLHGITLVGHDFGAGLALAYAVDNPDRIAKVVVLNGTCWDVSNDPMMGRIGRMACSAFGRALMTRTHSWPKLVRRTFFDRTKFTDSFAKAIEGPFLEPESRYGIWKTVKALSASGPYFEDAWRSKQRIADVPFQFVWGMNDPLLGEKALNRWWHDFPISPVTRIERTGHFPMEERPPQVLSAIQEFLVAPSKVRYLA